METMMLLRVILDWKELGLCPILGSELVVGSSSECGSVYARRRRA